jgi:hypothetical protein
MILRSLICLILVLKNLKLYITTLEYESIYPLLREIPQLNARDYITLRILTITLIQNFIFRQQILTEKSEFSHS